VLAGAAIVYFAYIGFDSVSCQAEETEKPERDLPIAIILSLVISTVLYVSVAVVLTGIFCFFFLSSFFSFLFLCLSFSSLFVLWQEWSRSVRSTTTPRFPSLSKGKASTGPSF
jgi:L-asparagine transporter-like permease